MAALSVVLIGCDGDAPGADPPSRFTRFDSSGVTISVTPGDVATAPLPWSVGDVPDLVIGDDTTPGELIFSVAGVAALPDGGLVVVDRGDLEVRFFDAAGGFRGSLGGAGRGPGEFQAIALVPAVDTDSIIVFDRALRRFHHVSAVDFGFRVLSVASFGGGRRRPSGIVGGQILLWWGGVITRPPPGPSAIPVTLRWLDPVRLENRTITSVTLTGRFSEHVPDSPAPVGWRIPFTLDYDYPPAVVTRRGALLHVGRPAELKEFGLDGHLRRVFRVDLPDRPVTQELIDAQVDRYTSTTEVSARRYRGVLETMPLPEVLPAFGSLLHDPEGGTWAGVYEPGQSATRWIVFDDTGRALGTVTTPEGVAVQAVTSTSVLGVWTGPLGVQEVRRYSLERR